MRRIASDGPRRYPARLELMADSTAGDGSFSESGPERQRAGVPKRSRAKAKAAVPRLLESWFGVYRLGERAEYRIG